VLQIIHLFFDQSSYFKFVWRALVLPERTVKNEYFDDFR
jgi:hypothetical protein